MRSLGAKNALIPFKKHSVVYKKHQIFNILDNKPCKRRLICRILIKFAAKNKKSKRMRRIIIPFAILFSALVLTASCLNDDNDDNITYYGDTAITSFSLGTMNRYLTTKALTQVDENGNPLDSVYKETYTGSSYVFTIDQLQREIYNPDSLPLPPCLATASSSTKRLAGALWRSCCWPWHCSGAPLGSSLGIGSKKKNGTNE